LCIKDCDDHTRSPLRFTVILVSTKQHTSGLSPPPPRSTNKSIQLYETTICSPEYRTANSTHPYKKIDIDHLVCKNTWQCHQEII